jgi:hypothetical protein
LVGSTDFSSLATGSRYSSDEYLNIPDKPSEFFAYRAKALLDIEMDKPTLSTLQAVIIISMTEGAAGRESRGKRVGMFYDEFRIDQCEYRLDVHRFALLPGYSAVTFSRV